MTIVDYELPAPGSDGRTVAYQLVDVPFDPTTLTRALSVSGPADDVEFAARWVDTVLPERLAVAESVFGQLGAPPIDPQDPRPGLLAFGTWLQGWFPSVADPYVQRSHPGSPDWTPKWITIEGGDRLGSVSASWPGPLWYSNIGDAVLHSLVVDVTALVMDCVEYHLPMLVWSVQPEATRLHLVVHPGSPVFAPLEQVRELLLQSVGPARGERGRSLRRRQSRILVDCFDQAVTGVAPEPSEQQFPEIRPRLLSRFVVTRPSRTAPAAPRHLVDALARLRSIGWYATWKYSDADLATAVAAAWEGATGRSLPSEPADLWTCLLLVDADRTWFEDVDVHLGAQDSLYGETIFGLARIGGRAFGRFADPAEDWHSTPGFVEFSVRWNRKIERFRIPKTSDGLLHPLLLQEINARLPASGPRLYFLDLGPTVAVAIRLSEDERRKLHTATGLDLLDAPPSWWMQAADHGVASLPPHRADPLLLGTPVHRPRQPGAAPTFDAEDDEIRGVTVTDVEVDGRPTFQVAVSAAEFLRGGSLDDALDARITDALQRASGVLRVTRTDREVWEVLGDPNEDDLEEAVSGVLESIFKDFAEEIGNIPQPGV